MIEWIVMGGIVVSMYMIINKYEKKMEDLQKKIDSNKDNIDKNHDKIKNNHGRLDEHYNHLEKLWVASPKVRKKNTSNLTKED